MRAWPVAFSVVAYGAVFVAAAVLLGPLGLVGGLLLSLVGAACFSGYLTLLSQAVSGTPVRWADFKRSFGAMFWDVVSVLFALWIISLAAGVVARGAGPQGPAIAAIVGITMAFFFNAVPELLYQGQTRSFQLLLASGRFVLAHPLAWFLPNVLFAIALLAPTGTLQFSHPGEAVLLFGSIFSPRGVVAVFGQIPLWAAPLLLLFLHFAMVFRGLLFQDLESGGVRRAAWQGRFS